MVSIVAKLKTEAYKQVNKKNKTVKEKDSRIFKSIRIKKVVLPNLETQKLEYIKLYVKFKNNAIPAEGSIYKDAEFAILGNIRNDKYIEFEFKEGTSIGAKIPKDINQGQYWSLSLFRIDKQLSTKKIKIFYNSLPFRDRQIIHGICSAFSNKDFVTNILEDVKNTEGYFKESNDFWLKPGRVEQIVTVSQRCKKALPANFDKSNRIAEAFNELPRDMRIKIQSSLKKRGLYRAGLDGSYGPSTKRAIEKQFGKRLFKKNVKQELLNFVTEKNTEKVAGAIQHREKELKEALSLAKKLETEKLEAEEQVKAIESKRGAELERIRKDKDAAIEAEREKINGLETALRIAESRARLETETVVGERDKERRLEFEKLQEEREAVLKSERQRIKALEETLIKKEEALNLQRKGELEELEKAKETELLEEKKKIIELEKALRVAEKSATKQAQRELKRLDEKRQQELEKVRAEKEEALLKEREKIAALEQKLAKISSQKDVETLGLDNSEKVMLPPEWMPFFNFMPLQQNQFCQLTDRFFEGMDKAIKSGNEIKVNMVHQERQENFDGLLPGGEINNWIFKVVKVEQVDDGSAAVVLSLHCKSFVGSGQVYSSKRAWREKDNKEWRATIPYDDRRFRELAKLDRGQFVLASGILLEIDAFKPGQIETFYASQTIGEHPLTKDLNLEGELFLADLQYIAALN